MYPTAVVCLRALMLVSAFSLISCATTRRGSIVMKLNDSQAHVGMGQGEVDMGDHVQLYRNICSGGRGDRSCRKEAAGHGEITSVLNADYSVVQFPVGTTFQEGDTIEKHPH